MQKKKIGGFIIKRHTQFKGPRKIGIDSSCLYDLITSPELFSDQHARIFKIKGIFFTHRICFSEVRDKLIEKKGYKKEEAEKEVKNFLNENNINIIEKDFTKQHILKELYKRCKENNIAIHPPDSFIIADLIKQGINKIFSTNNHFRDACNIVGIDGSGFPSFDKELGNKIRHALFRPKKKTTRRR